MESNKAGIHTKELIVNTAKKLFYEYGYEDISLSQICQEADITRTKFFYYFKNKEELADFISNEIIRRCEGEIGADLLKKYYKDSTICAGIAIYKYFESIVADEKLVRFYSEVLKRNSTSLIGSKSYKSMLMMLALKSKQPKSEFDIYYVATTSIPGSLFYAYRDGIIKKKEDIPLYLLKSSIFPLYGDETVALIERIVTESKNVELDLTKTFLSEYKSELFK